jgi:hypothetical protein
VPFGSHALNSFHVTKGIFCLETLGLLPWIRSVLSNVREKIVPFITQNLWGFYSRNYKLERKYTERKCRYIIYSPFVPERVSCPHARRSGC